ncbi:small integral membrane protein 24 [Phalacrocorax aristotelis]|uniref:small integral membrane protein 24 n=1 Tax=Phalacrocorax aristotelis TaxID=126867 RepID=UPI003F4BE27D
MPRASQPLLLLVFLVLTTTAQGQAGTGPKELQPWLVSLTAVVVFLFIVFVLLLVSRLWQMRMHRWARVAGTHPAPASARGAGAGGAAGSGHARGWEQGAGSGRGDPRALLSPSLPSQEAGRPPGAPGDWMEHVGCANPAAEDGNEENDGEEQSKATSF